MGAEGNRGLQEMATLESAWQDGGRAAALGAHPKQLSLLDMERQKYKAQREVLLCDIKNLQYYLRYFARLLEFVPDTTGQVAKIRAQMLQAHADSSERMSNEHL